MISYLRREAEEDLSAAAAWYETQRAGLGKAFLDEVLTAVERLERQPLAYPKVYKHVRRALLRRFPFAIYYLLEADVIVILGVLHGRRHPGRWRRRV